MPPVNYNPAAPLYENARQDPDRIALWVEGTAYTYDELSRRAALVAGWLRLAAGSDLKRVAILCGRSIAAYESILGTCWAGACYVPLNRDFDCHQCL